MFMIYGKGARVIFNPTRVGVRAQRTALDSQTNIASNISSNLFRTKLVKYIFSCMIPGSHDVIPLVSWSKFYFQKKLTTTKLWALRSPNFFFMKSAVAYISNKRLIVSITHFQNLWIFPFLHKNYRNYDVNQWKMLTSFRNYLTEEMLIWYIKDITELCIYNCGNPTLVEKR